VITINLTSLNQIKLLQFWLTNSANEQEMSKIVFVPLTDEMVFEHPELITGPVTTYKPVTSRKSNHFLTSKDSLRTSGVSLKGDMVNGFDVVYAALEPSKRVQG
jgi:hypothetical protein